MTRGTGALSPEYDEALLYASSIHKWQKRKGTEIAYLSHLMTVSALVLEDDGTEEQAIAGLLHDAIEDGPPSAAKEIERRFGKAVRVLVEACSDGLPGERSDQPWTERKQVYVAHLADAPLAALSVTAADKLHNLRCTLDDLHMAKAAGKTPTWPKSNACVHQNLWYYASVLDQLQRRLPDSRTCSGLMRTLADVCDLLGLAQPPASATVPSCSSCTL